MQVYLPIAELSMNLFFLVGIGGAVGFLSGLFGVGGGFLLTPLLIFSGVPSSVAVASVTGQVVAASTSGALSYYRRGQIDLHLSIYLVLSSILGSFLGVWIFGVLRDQEMPLNGIFGVFAGIALLSVFVALRIRPRAELSA